MATLTDLISRVRLELGDQQSEFKTVLKGDGVTKDFYAEVKPLEPAYLVVTNTVGAVSTTSGTTTSVTISTVVGTTTTPLAQGTDFTVEENTGMIHFQTAPANNATINISGTHYRYFSNKDIIAFINTAVGQHTFNRTDSYGRQMTMALLPAVEEYPVAILATCEALWALATDAAFDIDISAPDGVTIPRHQRFSQLSTMIANRRQQYSELCAALNIGLWRVEMGTLRRVSRTTNKLVPIYVPQEIDDARKPERVYLQNDLMGRTPVPSSASSYDIILTQGDSWSATFDFPNTMEALEDFTITAQIRNYPQSPTLIGSFYVAIASSAARTISLSLTPEQTKNFPLKSFWDLQFSKYQSGVKYFEQTYVQGLVFTNPRVTDDTLGLPSSLTVLSSVRTISLYNITLSGLQTIDGVTLAAGDRVLVNGQTNNTTNGIYIASASSWTRASDASNSNQFVSGMTVYVDKGATTYGNTGWTFSGTFPAILGTSAITFVRTVNR